MNSRIYICLSSKHTRVAWSLEFVSFSVPTVHTRQMLAASWDEPDVVQNLQGYS